MIKNNKVLLLYGHKNNIGGVANFYNDLKDEFENSSFNIKHFRIGHIQNSKLHNNKLVSFLDFIYRYILFVFVLFKYKPNILHINPSTAIKSVIRDSIFINLTKIINPNIKVLTHFRGWDSEIMNSIYKPYFINYFIKNILKKTDFVIVLAELFKKEISKYFDKTKVEVIYTNVKSNLYKNEIYKKNVQTNFLFLSRIEKNKGIYELIEAIKILSKTKIYKNTKFLIAGDGSETKNIKKYCSENKIEHLVEFLGYVKGNKKITTMHCADVFVFPSYKEGCPNAVLEALASGLPVIYTPVGALKELLANNVNGYMIESHSANQIFKAVEYILQNQKNLPIISKNNRKLSENFRTDIIFNQIEKVYNRLTC